MAQMEKGKKYLLVFCKKCDKAFRVIDRPVEPGEKLNIPGPQNLKCRGCGHVAMYDPKEMRTGQLSPKPARNRN